MNNQQICISASFLWRKVNGDGFTVSIFILTIFMGVRENILKFISHYCLTRTFRFQISFVKSSSGTMQFCQDRSMYLPKWHTISYAPSGVDVDGYWRGLITTCTELPKAQWILGPAVYSETVSSFWKYCYIGVFQMYFPTNIIGFL